jgi:hypothetical protein
LIASRRAEIGGEMIWAWLKLVEGVEEVEGVEGVEGV